MIYALVTQSWVQVLQAFWSIALPVLHSQIFPLPYTSESAIQGADITSDLNAFDAAKQAFQNTHDSNVVGGLKDDNVVAASPGLQ